MYQPQNLTPNEIPVINLSGMYGNLESRKAVASQVKTAVSNYGYFYIKNHGVSKEIIESAERQAKRFFNQPDERVKGRVDNGWVKMKVIRPGAEVTCKWLYPLMLWQD